SEPEASEIAADLREDVGDELEPVSYQADPPARGPSTAAAVATLSLNGRRTGPYEQDGQPGTDGLQVWLEPKAANGTIVATAGSATIALLDPHQPRSAKPLARWQVSSADLRRHQTYQGIRLRLRWPHQAPPLAQAVLFVRMITEDGLWIYADQTLALDGKGQEDERPLVAKRRPEKPPTVSPTRPATTSRSTSRS
nr:hypothetical protein [Planctomycetales bacterium]